MFYNIIQRTTRYFFAILFLITGFAFAFFVLQTGMERSEDSFYFNIWNMEMSSLVMSTGEFDFRGFFEAFDEDENKIIVVFSMILLFIMILFVTITMLNLLQAVIIQDYNSLIKDAYVQNLIFMSSYIHNMETMVHGLKYYSYIFRNLFSWVENSLKLEKVELFYCPCQHCSQECLQDTEAHIEPHFKQIIRGFNNILEYKTEQESIIEIKRKNEGEVQSIREEIKEVKNDLKSILSILQSRNNVG
jgi:hypothetical protein